MTRISNFKQYSPAQEIINKLDLSDYHLELLKSFPAKDCQHILKVLNHRNSGWVNAYVQFIIDMSMYDNNRFDFTEEYPGGNGSKVALKDLFSGISCLKMEKSPTVSPTGRKSKKTLSWIEINYDNNEMSKEELKELKLMFPTSEKTRKFPFTPFKEEDDIWIKN